MGKGMFLPSFWLPFCAFLTSTGYTQNVNIQKLLAKRLEHTGFWQSSETLAQQLLQVNLWLEASFFFSFIL